MLALKKCYVPSSYTGALNNQNLWYAYMYTRVYIRMYIISWSLQSLNTSRKCFLTLHVIWCTSKFTQLYVTWCSFKFYILFMCPHLLVITYSKRIAQIGKAWCVKFSCVAFWACVSLSVATRKFFYDKKLSASNLTLVRWKKHGQMWKTSLCSWLPCLSPSVGGKCRRRQFLVMTLSLIGILFCWEGHQSTGRSYFNTSTCDFFLVSLIIH